MKVAANVITESVFSITGKESAHSGITESDRRHIADSHGRLALGPCSQIAQNKIIKIHQTIFDMGNGMTQIGPARLLRFLIHSRRQTWKAKIDSSAYQAVMMAGLLGES